MKNMLTRFGVSAGVVVVAQALTVGSAIAVPSDRQAWSSEKYGVTVYHDELDTDLFWFVPLIRFESANGKTVLRPSTLADGKVEYITRIIPYFPEDIRDLVTRNIPNIRQDSQLKPIVAKNVGVSLPDFGYKTTSETVTSIEYLNVPRIVRFQLDADEARLFDTFYAEELGVPAAFTFSYDGVLKDKFYQIAVSCKQVNRELDVGVSPSASGTAGKIRLGASIETAFRKAIQNTNDGIDIVQKGDAPELADALREVFTLCFDPVDPIDDTTRDWLTGSDDDDGGDDGLHPRGGRDDTDVGEDGDASSSLIPKATAKVRFKYKNSSETDDRTANVKQVSLKDTTNTSVVFGTLTAVAPPIEKVTAEPLASKSFVVSSTNTAIVPFRSGIRIAAGQQWTINAEVSLKKNGKPMAIPAGLKADASLYYRIGDGEWLPVNRHLVLASDFARGAGELQFYVDSAAIRAQVPKGPWGPEKGVTAEYSVSIGGQTVVAKK